MNVRKLALVLLIREPRATSIAPYLSGMPRISQTLPELTTTHRNQEAALLCLYKTSSFPVLLGVLPLHKKTFAGCTRCRESKALSGPLGISEGTASETGSNKFQTCG